MSEQRELARSNPLIRLHFYTRADCPLCDRLEALLRPLLQLLEELTEVEITKRDIFDDAAWREAYQYRIPVLTCDDKVLLEGRPELSDVAMAFEPLLREAQRRA